MGFMDRLFGLHRPHVPSRTPGGWGARTLDEEQALQRYRYLVRTAPPEALEEMYLEAFSRLPSEQREQAAQALDALLPAGERRQGASPSDPPSLARRATRAELLQPGTVERAFGGLRTDGGRPHADWRGGEQRYAQARRGWGGASGWGSGWGMGSGLGGMFAGSLLSSLVGTAIGSMVAHQFLDGFDAHEGAADPSPEAEALGPDEGGGWDEPGGGDDLGGGDFGDGGFGDDL